MNISLNQFEQIIDETILKRGLSYFKNGAITDFTEVSSGEYEATIEGTDEYTVYIKVKNQVITEHQCDCPYDLGPVCKHIVLERALDTTKKWNLKHYMKDNFKAF